MLLKSLLIACLNLSLALSMFAQASGTAADPLSGTWTGEPSGVVFELKFDGKGTVSGTVTPKPGPIKGTFDPKTGALKIEGDTTAPDGTPCRFVIEGKVDNGTATGTAICGSQKVGDFRITKQ